MCFTPRQILPRHTYLLLCIAITFLATTIHSYQPAIGRRQAFTIASGTATAALFTTTTSPVAAAAPSFQRYNDATHGFSLSIPSDWTLSEQRLADRRTLKVWTDPTDAATAVFVAFTPVRDDFTSLGSFGSVDQVAQQTILPKAQLMDPESTVQAKLISAQSVKQAYVFDYIQSVGSYQPPTHFRTIFALSPGAAGGAVLVTITAQTPEERYPALQTTLDAMIDSYGKSV